jgi:hypothetical protein
MILDTLPHLLVVLLTCDTPRLSIDCQGLVLRH